MKSGALLASFAHLIPFGQAAAKPKAEDETDDDKKEREASERTANEKATGKAETDDEREKREEEEARAAADDDDEQCAEDDDEKKDDDEEAKKAIAGGHAKGVAAARRAGSRAAKARVAQIMGAKVAARNPALALRLALGKMPVPEALAILGELPGPVIAALPTGAKPLADRMRETQTPAVGPGGGKPAPTAGSVADAAAHMVALGKKTGSVAA